MSIDDICSVLNEATNYGFVGNEVRMVKEAYFVASKEYRTTHEEPVAIDDRLDYAERVRSYSAGVARNYMKNKINEWNRK